MQEKIYTIPVNEAYDMDLECPMCYLENQLEEDALDYTLGAAMMEQDFRAYSDKNGYCNRHFGMLFDRPNKLPLALILDTHMQEIRKSLGKTIKHTPKNGGLLRRKDSYAAKVSEAIKSIEEGCIVCEKINKTLERYADVLMYMWANDSEFREKFDRSKGLCLKHTGLLCDMADKSIGSKSSSFVLVLTEKLLSNLDRIQDDIHHFTEKFDYRNKDMEWGTAKDAPIRTIEKLSGYIKNKVK